MMKFKNKKMGINLYIDESALKKAKECCFLSKEDETGGIILGYYSKNYKFANICVFSNRPSDSVSSRNTFVRGFKKLKQLINFLFKANKYYYLGEWHYHPVEKVLPSGVDEEQMKQISENEKFDCRVPILIILSKNEIGCYVYKDGLTNLPIVKKSS